VFVCLFILFFLSCFLRLSCLLCFFYLFVFSVLLIIPIAIRVRAPIPALLACLWEEEILLAVGPRKLLKVSRLTENLACSNISVQTRSKLNVFFRRLFTTRPGVFLKTPFQGSAPMFFKIPRKRSAWSPVFHMLKRTVVQGPAETHFPPNG
jgi:hypothetical protein